MDGIHAFTTPLPLTFTLDGVEWQLSPINFGDYGEIERRAIDSMPHPLEEAKRVLSSLSEDNSRSLVESAWRESVKMRRLSPDDVSTYLRSPDGTQTLLWLSLSKRHDITESQLRAMVAAMTPEDYGRLVALVSEASGRPKN